LRLVHRIVTPVCSHSLHAQLANESVHLYYNSIFMEHVPGGTLRDLIVNMAQLPDSVASIYTHQLLLGLAFLHSCGAAHHTLCATNVSAAALLLFTCHASAELLNWASASHHNEVLIHSTRDAYSFDCMCKGGSLNDNACVASIALSSCNRCLFRTRAGARA
jgi:hypothetical protein